MYWVVKMCFQNKNCLGKKADDKRWEYVSFFFSEKQKSWKRFNNQLIKITKMHSLKQFSARK